MPDSDIRFRLSPIHPGWPPVTARALPATARVLPVLALILTLAAAGCGTDPTEPVSTGCDDLGDICTIMGTGLRAYNGDGNPPRETALYNPIDLIFDAQGRLVVLDFNNQYVRRLDHDGLVHNILGNGVEANVINGTPALESSLHHAFSFAYDAAGVLYLAGNHIPQVIRLDKEGLVWVEAGLETEGYSGDGGNALEAEMRLPCGIAVAAAGYPKFIADTYNHVIRRIDASGTISTIAGDGTSGYSGDGGPAANARLDHPFRIRYHEIANELYIADTYNHAVRKIDSNGVITTIAGTGTAGFSGDGGPGTAAQLDTPMDARVGPDGAVYIADADNNRVRRLDPSGTITTLAGTGEEGNSGDGGPAAQAELHYPAAIAFDTDGNLWFADSNNSTIRKVVLTEP